MCFSAEASFIASGYLATLGYLAWKKNNINRAKYFAAIPIIFALQQFDEGMLWLSLSRAWPMVQTITSYGFLFFAFFLWPMWIPIAVRSLEHDERRKRFMTVLVFVGVSVALYLYGYVLAYGVQPSGSGCHIYYGLNIPYSETILGSIFYLLATVMPFFISSLPILWLFGLFLLISYWLTYIFYYTYLVSLWCYFAAILSGFAYVVIVQLNTKKNA